MNQLNQNLTFFILIIFENQWDFYIFYTWPLINPKIPSLNYTLSNQRSKYLKLAEKFKF